MNDYKQNCHKKIVNAYNNFQMMIDITQYSLEELNSVSYQEPYGRQSMYSILSNNINDNLEQESILSTGTSDQSQH